ncbi:DUF805 domain-containing protein [Qipengyuania sp. 1XM1-15A]|uniref:DUF805 domain-containing protein n=1 Tax=Qipengyuania xiamenensis TaxID=2867237 RepID=UPI001C888697|nr:DUF805 domain-containing protein [Qipengyuania xiamenensis]
MTSRFRSPLFDIPGDLAKTVSGLFRFHGRSTRTEVWTYALIGGLLASFLQGAFELALGEEGYPEPTVGSTLTTIAYLLPYPALMARRLHDMGKSGWYALLLLPLFTFLALSEGGSPEIVGVDKVLSGWWVTLLGVIGILLSFVPYFVPPDEGDNRFGPNPRLGRLGEGRALR